MWNHWRTLADRLNIYRHLHLTSFVFYVLCKHVIFFLYPQLWRESRGRLMKIVCRCVIDCTDSQSELSSTQNQFHVNQQWHFFISLNVPGLQSFFIRDLCWRKESQTASKTMCATVQIILLFIKRKQNRREEREQKNKACARWISEVYIIENDFFTKRGSCTCAGFKKLPWVIMLSFHAVSALLFGGSVTLVLYFTPRSFREPSSAALLSPLITGGVLGLHKFSQRKATRLI